MVNGSGTVSTFPVLFAMTGEDYLIGRTQISRRRPGAQRGHVKRAEQAFKNQQLERE